MQSSTRTILASAVVSGLVSLLVSVSLLQAKSTPSPSSSLNSTHTDANGAVSSSHPNTSIIDTVKRAEPAVVSVTISKDVPILQRGYRTGPSTGNPFFDQFFRIDIPDGDSQGTRRTEVGGGTAFFVSSDGLLMTNKHVVSDPKAQYTVLLNDGRTLKATVAALDPVNDIALIKVEGSRFPFLHLQAEGEPQLGQTVIAIGNALGEFRNTVSVGVISGLQREITAGNPAVGETERLTRILQTDAAINEGNSGGPLLNEQGEVLAMSTAIATDAQNIGFAIPALDLQAVLKSYQQYGHIVRPYIGVRYMPITPELAAQQHLPSAQGNLIVRGDTATDLAVVPGSPADKAGLMENDIILEIDGEKLSDTLTLSDAIARKQPGDQVTLLLLHKGERKTVTVTLGEWKE